LDKKNNNNNSEESIASLYNNVNVWGYFNDITHMNEAYDNLVNGPHKDYVMRIKPELNTDDLRLVVNMGVEAKMKGRVFLPVVGEI